MEFTFVHSELGPSQTESTAPSVGTNKFKWATSATPETRASRKKAPLKQSSVLSDIRLNKMKVSPEQFKQLEEIYRSHATAVDNRNSPVDHLYRLDDDDQLAASAIMAQQGLDVDTREQLDNRWSHQWSSYSHNSLNARNRTRRILYLWYAVQLLGTTWSYSCNLVDAAMTILKLRRRHDTLPFPLPPALPTPKLPT